jgi:cation diffusion facilitator CzcD-associated flavoprotein CzcO
VDAEGTEHRADAIVMATGFQPWNFVSSLEIVGKDGRRLDELWGDAPAAFLGTMVARFPNLFLLYGPNSNVGCITAVLERQVEFVMRAVRRMERCGGRELEVSQRLMDAFNRVLDRRNDQRTWEDACSNYYHPASGRNVTQWPWTSTAYWLALRSGHRLLEVG